MIVSVAQQHGWAVLRHGKLCTEGPHHPSSQCSIIECDASGISCVQDSWMMQAGWATAATAGPLESITVNPQGITCGRGLSW